MSTPRLLAPSNDGDVIVCYDRSKLCLYTLNGKLMRQAIFEDETIQVRNFMIIRLILKKIYYFRV
jgi:hypothetical protein